MKRRAQQRVIRSAGLTLSSASDGVLRLLKSSGSASKETGILGGQVVVPVFGEVATIGRGLHNTVVLIDPAASRDHARLERTPSGWCVQNTSERNPLWAAGAMVTPGERRAIAPGEVMRLGISTLQLLAPAAGPPPRDAEQAEHAEHGAVAAPIPDASGGTHLLGPGITLQFAVSGQRGARAWWLAGVAAAVIFLVCAVITIGTATLVGRSTLADAGWGQLLAAVTIPLVPALGVSVLVGIIDRYEREPWLLLFGAFLWGAVIAIPPVLVVEHVLDAALVGGGTASGAGTLAALAHAAAQATITGLTEEVFKGAGLVVLLVALRDEFDNVTDGILYGLLIGAGFAMVENFVYFAVSPRGDLGLLILGRVVLGWLSHSTFTALLGAGLGYAREARQRRWRRLAPLFGLLAAVALHTLFDFVAFTATILARQGLAAPAPGLFGVATLAAAYTPLFAAEAVLLRMVLASLRREAEVVREYLAPELLAGVVTSDEYMLVQNATLRGLAERRTLVTYGLRAYLTARALHQTATGLAFRKWHVAMGDPVKAAERQPEDAYRERIGRLRRSLVRQLAARRTEAALPGTALPGGGAY